MQQSLKDLGVDQLDLLLLHWPEAWLPGSDPNGEVHPDTSITLLEAWCVMQGLCLCWCGGASDMLVWFLSASYQSSAVAL